MSKFILALAAWLFSASLLLAQPKPTTEDDYYKLITIPTPPGCELEVGGLDWLDAKQTRLAVCTRRGEVWVIDNPYATEPALAGTKVKVTVDGKTIERDPTPEQTVAFKQMLFGLHEALGLCINPKGFPPGIYTAQRGELTRLVDHNGDDRIDLADSFCNSWQISGSYHEYAFGPKLDRDGHLWVTLNRQFGGGQEAQAMWRGWAVKVDKDGKMHPVCPGLRSPAGLGMNCAGDMFYTDNQGDHVAAGKMSHLKPDTFQGQPEGLASLHMPEANFKKPEGKYPITDIPWGEAVTKNAKLQAPCIWFPYPEMGNSQTDIVCDETGGKFGPFAGQTFVGDLSQARIMRVTLEKIDGEYQGACFPFRKGLLPPVLRMVWGSDGSLFAGGSSRGWGGGARPWGLQRVVWTGKLPFEVHEMKVTPEGFNLTFTQPVDAKTAGDVKSYAMNTWYYNYSGAYGDKPRDLHTLEITAANVAADGKSVALTIAGRKPYHVCELILDGVRNTAGEPLLHPIGYYTLNRIPN